MSIASAASAAALTGASLRHRVLKSPPVPQIRAGCSGAENNATQQERASEDISVNSPVGLTQ